MLPAGGLGGKYALGKMAEIMITCNELIFKIQEEVYKASREAMAMEEIPAVCTGSTTCFGDKLDTIPEKTPINRSTSLPTPPELKNVRDPRLRQLYQKLMDLESVGRLEWLKVFMYMSNYMRVLRPIPRGEWDKPKKFVQRQTLTLDGPYPGISSDLIVPGDTKPSGVTHFEKIVRKTSANFVPLRPPMKVKNVQLKNVGDDNREFLFTTRPCPRPSRYDPRVLCDCLEVVRPSSSSSDSRRKRLTGKIRPQYFPRYDYCMD